MSMQHKAFAFDWHAFEERLAPELHRALEIADTTALAAFIERNREALRWPDSGERIAPGWVDAMTARDIQEYADLALTAFYDPSMDVGLGTRWQAAEDALHRCGLDPCLLLGTAFGPPLALFDPGRMGAYFQTAAAVAVGLRALHALPPAPPKDASLIALVASMLGRAAAASSGLYVTF